MEIIKPEENIQSVINLINEAKEFVVIVSPYNDLDGWDELIGAINEANERIGVSYYVREDQGMKGIEKIAATVYGVPLLHAKMIFSESEAIITSSNLTNQPAINWFCRLNKAEYKDLLAYFDTYIKPLSSILNIKA